MARYGPIRTRSRRAATVALLLVAYLFVTPLPGRATGAPTWKVIVAGWLHTCAIAKTDGSVWCWGNGNTGQVGDGLMNVDHLEPVEVASGEGQPSTYVDVVAGLLHTCALATDGSVWCWGYGASGQLGNGSTSNSVVPVHVSGSGPGGTVFTSLAAGGGFHTCARSNVGEVWCWGDGSWGQVAAGPGLTPTPVSEPTLVFTDDSGSLSAVSVGSTHTCARASDQKVWCWGYGGNGQLGTGSTSGSDVPVQVSGTGGAGTTFDVVATNFDHNCGITSSSALYCWGSNVEGELGDKTYTSRSTLTLVDTIGDFGLYPPASYIAVAPGLRHTCAIATGGAAWCWGNGGAGRLGAELPAGETYYPFPLPVDSMLEFKQISAGGWHTCAIAADDTAWCWGQNLNGQLGDGTSSTAMVPVQVLGGPPGGGATCEEAPDVACHEVTYEILSARSIALASAAAVDFGRVRQGHTAQEPGPDIYYATTWAGDAITVDISEDSEPGIALLFDVLSIAEPSGEVECESPGNDSTTEPAELSTTASPVITGIDDCGEPSASDSTDGATATTRFTVDATAATVADTNYTTPVTTTVTYTIDAG